MFLVGLKEKERYSLYKQRNTMKNTTLQNASEQEKKEFANWVAKKIISFKTPKQLDNWLKKISNHKKQTL